MQIMSLCPRWLSKRGAGIHSALLDAVMDRFVTRNGAAEVHRWLQ